MKSFVRNNLFGFLIGIILCSGIVYATNYYAKDISYEPSDTSWEVNNVSEALNSLYNNKNSSNLKIYDLSFNGDAAYNYHIIFDISETSYTKIKFNARVGANTPKNPTISFSEDLTNWTSSSITLGDNYVYTYNEFPIPENTKYVKIYWNTSSGRGWFNNLSFE